MKSTIYIRCANKTEIRFLQNYRELFKDKNYKFTYTINRRTEIIHRDTSYIFEPCGVPFFLDVMQPISRPFEVGTWNGRINFSGGGVQIFNGTLTTTSDTWENPVANIVDKTSTGYLRIKNIHPSSWAADGTITFEQI